MLFFTSISFAQVTTPKTVRLWKAKCASCHGELGQADTEQGKKMGVLSMSSAEFWKGLTKDKFDEIVLGGFKRTKNGKDQEMKPFRDQLTLDQLKALWDYIHSFKKD